MNPCPPCGVLLNKWIFHKVDIMWDSSRATVLDERNGGGVAETFEEASALFRVLGSPVRVSIVTLLSENDMKVHELVAALSLSQPLVSQHLRILRSHGVVRARRSGREMIYTLSDRHVAELVEAAAAHVTQRAS